MSTKREKELKRLIYIRSELIKDAKKDIKVYKKELTKIQNRKKWNKWMKIL